MNALVSALGGISTTLSESLLLQLLLPDFIATHGIWLLINLLLLNCGLAALLLLFY